MSKDITNVQNQNNYQKTVMSKKKERVSMDRDYEEQRIFSEKIKRIISKGKNSLRIDINARTDIETYTNTEIKDFNKKKMANYLNTNSNYNIRSEKTLGIDNVNQFSQLKTATDIYDIKKNGSNYTEMGINDIYRPKKTTVIKQKQNNRKKEIYW